MRQKEMQKGVARLPVERITTMQGGYSAVVGHCDYIEHRNRKGAIALMGLYFMPPSRNWKNRYIGRSMEAKAIEY